MIGTTKLKTGGQFEPMPSGKYTLQLVEGNQIKDSYKGQEQDKFKFTFVILNDVEFTTATGEKKTTRGRLLWHKFSTYFTPKSFLFAFVKIFDPSIVDLTVEQRETYDLDSLVGKQVDALVSKDANKDNTATYNNIQSFEKCEKELEAIEDMNVTAEVVHTASVPVTAPADEPKQETADSFVASLGKENEAVQTKKAVEASDEEKEIAEMEAKLEAKKKIAAAKAKAVK